MFTIFSLRKSREISYRQRIMLHELISAYADTAAGSWLNSYFWRGYKIKWCPAMNCSGGDMGAFLPWIGKKVYLMPDAANSDTWMIGIAPTLVHELRHVWQYHRHPVLYVLCCLPGLRQITLERDAWAATKPAEDFFSRLDAIRCAAKFNLTTKTGGKQNV